MVKVVSHPGFKILRTAAEISESEHTERARRFFGFSIVARQD
jgi:hypothetical protein